MARIGLRVRIDLAEAGQLTSSQETDLERLLVAILPFNMKQFGSGFSVGVAATETGDAVATVDAMLFATAAVGDGVRTILAMMDWMSNDRFSLSHSL